MNSSDPRILLTRAAQLERAGQLAEAESLYVRVLARTPSLPDTWYNLARLQRRAGRYEAALRSYEQALAHGVATPEEVHLNRGVIYSDCLRRDAPAEAEWNTALALNPGYIPALLNLGNLKEDFGKRQEARALYERALAIDAGCFEALARLANLSTVTDPFDPLIDRLRQALADPAGSDADKASIGFALGRLLDACGDYDAAFAEYSTANRHSRRSAVRPAVYDRAAQERLTDELIASFDIPGPSARHAADRARPLFICGMFRSGSTLTEQVLAAHSRVTSGGELGWIPTLAMRALAPFPAGAIRADQQDVERMAAQYVQALSQVFPTGDLVTDKRPDNFLYIGLIKRLFPNARIIHTTRNALDNCLSVYFLHLDHGMSYALDLLDTAHYYSQYRRLMRHWKSLYEPDILDVDYDALVREPRAQIEKLLSFCGLDWEDGCLSFHASRRPVRTASVWQVREPLYQRSSGRWRNYQAHLGALLDYLREACPDFEAR